MKLGIVAINGIFFLKRYYCFSNVAPSSQWFRSTDWVLGYGKGENNLGLARMEERLAQL